LSVGEPITYTRRQRTSKRKQPSSGGIVFGFFHASKKGPGATLTLTKKGIEKILFVVENELHDSSDSEFEKLLTLIRVSLKGKKRMNVPH